MEDTVQLSLPALAQEYGDEEFVEVDEIVFDPEFNRITINVSDPDEFDGFYQYSFNAWWHPEEDVPEIIVEDGSAVGVPLLEDARGLDHVTAIEMLEACEYARILL